MFFPQSSVSSIYLSTPSNSRAVLCILILKSLTCTRIISLIIVQYLIFPYCLAWVVEHHQTDYLSANNLLTILSHLHILNTTLLKLLFFLFITLWPCVSNKSHVLYLLTYLPLIALLLVYLKFKFNSHIFSNGCSITGSFSWSSFTLQKVMFMTVYDKWQAGTIVRLQINKTVVRRTHTQILFYAMCKIKPNCRF